MNVFEYNIDVVSLLTDSTMPACRAAVSARTGGGQIL